MNLVKIEQLPVPTERNPTPSLPAWLTSQEKSLVANLQLDPTTGKWDEPLTLPGSQMPTEGQRAAMEDHLRYLRLLLGQTPQNDEDFAKLTFAAITKLMLVKPARAGGAEASEARGEAYIMALDDVPYWAVMLAIRKWHRGECGTNEHGEAYVYRWAQESAD